MANTVLLVGPYTTTFPTIAIYSSLGMFGTIEEHKKLVVDMLE
jgi:hypothetical protein